MNQTITVSCKLNVHQSVAPEIDKTLVQFADACNRILDTAKKEKLTNTIKLHRLTYYQVKALTGLKANHVCQAIRRVVGNLKATYSVKTFKPTSMSLDVRTFVYNEEKQSVGITLINGRKHFELAIGNYQRGLLKGRGMRPPHLRARMHSGTRSGQSPTSATLVKRRNGSYYIQICVDIPTQPPGKTPRVVGVDLGRRAIAATSTGKSWDGEQLNQIRDRYSRVRANVQAKRTRFEQTLAEKALWAGTSVSKVGK